MAIPRPIYRQTILVLPWVLSYRLFFLDRSYIIELLRTHIEI
jgi:hypothetical protein